MVKKTEGECCGGAGGMQSCGTGGCMPHGGHRKCKGAMMLILGILFLLGTLGYVPEITFMKYWPVALILFGLHGLVCSCCQKK